MGVLEIFSGLFEKTLGVQGIQKLKDEEGFVNDIIEDARTLIEDLEPKINEEFSEIEQSLININRFERKLKKPERELKSLERLSISNPDKEGRMKRRIEKLNSNIAKEKAKIAKKAKSKAFADKLKKLEDISARVVTLLVREYLGISKAEHDIMKLFRLYTHKEGMTAKRDEALGKLRSVKEKLSLALQHIENASKMQERTMLISKAAEVKFLSVRFDERRIKWMARRIRHFLKLIEHEEEGLKKAVSEKDMAKFAAEAEELRHGFEEELARLKDMSGKVRQILQALDNKAAEIQKKLDEEGIKTHFTEQVKETEHKITREIKTERKHAVAH